MTLDAIACATGYAVLLALLGLALAAGAWGVAVVVRQFLGNAMDEALASGAMLHYRIWLATRRGDVPAAHRGRELLDNAMSYRADIIDREHVIELLLSAHETPARVLGTWDEIAADAREVLAGRRGRRF